MKLRLLVGIVGTLMVANMADAKPFAYVLNKNSGQNTGSKSGSISVIDMGADHTQVSYNPIVPGSPFSTMGDLPYSLVVSPKGGKIYVANQGTSGLNDQTLVIIDADTMQKVGPVTAFNGNLPYVPGGMALNKDETRLYVADQTESRVYVYDLNGNDLAPIGYLDASDSGAPTSPEGIALDETNGRLYVVKSLVHKVGIYDLSLVEADAVSVVKGSSFLQDAQMPFGSYPVGIAVAAGGKAYVTLPVSNNVATFTAADPATVTMVGSVAQPPQAPYGITTSTDGSKIYVGNMNDSGIMADSYLAATDALVRYPNLYSDRYGEYAIESSDPVLAPRVLVVNSLKSLAATTNSSVTVQSIGGGSPKTVTVGIRPGSIGNFMGPKLDYTLTTQITSGATSGTITPSQTVGAAANSVLAATGSYKTFKLTPNTANGFNSVGSVTVGGTSYGSATEFTVGPISSDLLVQVAFSTTSKYLLTAVVNGGGYCTLASAGGIRVVPPANSGSINLATAESDSIVATVAPGSEFKGWSGCTAISTTNIPNDTCGVTMGTSNTTVTALCELLPLRSDVKRGTKYYDTIELAVNDATNPATLVQIVANPTKMTGLPQDCNYTYGVQEITLSGGWDANFTTQSGHSILPIGSLTFTAGTMVADNLTIQ